MRPFAVLWSWVCFPVFVFFWMPLWARWLAVAAGLAGAVAVPLAVRHELRQRDLRKAAIVWDNLRLHVARQDLPGVRRSLDQLRELSPDDPGLARWEEALETGRAVPSDLAMVRMIMNEHLRHNRLEEAAREAAVRAAALPKDWQARCVLAHHELTRGRAEEAKKHLAALPSPFDLEGGVGPGPLLYALYLARQLDYPAPDLVNFLVLRLLPALESGYVPHILMTEKLQLLEAYAYAFRAAEPSADLGRFWVPAAALGRVVLNDPAATPDDLVRLGRVCDEQRPLLEQLRRTGKLPEAEAERLARELEERIRAVWTKVNERAPTHPAGYAGLARADAHAGKPADAEATLKRGLAACGIGPELLVALVQHYQQYDPPVALDLAARAVKERPRELALLQLLAEAAVSAQRRDLVLSACNDALALRPDLPWACRLKAQALLDVGRPTEAAGVLTPIEALLAGEEAGAELYVRALCAAGATGSIEPFLKQAAAGPKPAGPLTGGARALLAQGRPELAAHWAGEATQLDPEHRAARRVLADSLRNWAEAEGAPAWNAARVREAVRAYDWLRQREPQDLVVANNIAWLELKGLQQPQMAYRSTAPLRAAEAAPDLPPAMLETLGAVYLEVGQEEKAVRVLERATHVSDPRPGYFTHLALALIRLGRIDDARSALAKAAELPKSPREAEEYAQVRRLADAPRPGRPGGTFR